jgi:glutathione S-transferase
MAYLEEAVQTGKADPSALFAFFGRLNDTSAKEQQGWEMVGDASVQEALARLTPDAVRSELERRVTEAERQANVAVTQAKADAIEWTSRALTSLLATGKLPDWLVEARPELADITLSKTAASRRKGVANSAPKQPQSRAEALRLFLHSLDLSPAKAPEKKRGVWIKKPGYHHAFRRAHLQGRRY